MFDDSQFFSASISVCDHLECWCGLLPLCKLSEILTKGFCLFCLLQWSRGTRDCLRDYRGKRRDRDKREEEMERGRGRDKREEEMERGRGRDRDKREEEMKRGRDR